MTQCGSCVLSAVDEGEVASHYAQSKLVARKKHVCEECRRTIWPGEAYERVVAVWENRLHVLNTCVDCRSVMDVLFCEGVCHGMVLEDLLMHLEEGYVISEDCLAALTPGAREWVCDLMERQWAREEAEEDGEYPGGYGNAGDSRAPAGTHV